MTDRVLRYALLADGSSDRALLSIITWVVRGQSRNVEIPDPGFRVRVARHAITEEIRATVALHRPHLLFVHRDAERQAPELRRAEIPTDIHPLVRIVPVRMTEAWLLFDEQAIRRASDRPRSRDELDLPSLQRVEELSDPKARLHESLLVASGATGRRRKRFLEDMASRVQRVAELIDDFTPLRHLEAFQRFEQECAVAMQGLGFGA